MVRSLLPDASQSPSLLTASDLTQPEWPLSERSSRALEMSHILIWLSEPPEAIHSPSGPKATALIRVVWPVCRTSSGLEAGSVVGGFDSALERGMAIIIATPASNRQRWDNKG